MTTTTLSSSDIHKLLTDRREIAIIWCVEDVIETRPDLSEESAWAVLQRCESCHDANLGISWDVIRCIADEMFPEDDGGRDA